MRAENKIERKSRLGAIEDRIFIEKNSPFDGATNAPSHAYYSAAANRVKGPRRRVCRSKTENRSERDYRDLTRRVASSKRRTAQSATLRQSGTPCFGL